MKSPGGGGHIVFILNLYLLFLIVINDFPIVIDFDYQHQKQSKTFTKVIWAEVLIFPSLLVQAKGPTGANDAPVIL